MVRHVRHASIGGPHDTSAPLLVALGLPSELDEDCADSALLGGSYLRFFDE